MKETRGFTIIELIIVVVAVALLAAVLLPASTHCARRTVLCQANLRSLWQSQFNYAAQYSRPQGIMLTHTGASFWLRLQQAPHSTIVQYEGFFCPLSDDEIVPGATSYRGPAMNVNKLDDADVIGADREGNHGPGRGGNVLAKTGDVSEVKETDELWLRARTTTKE